MFGSKSPVETFVLVIILLIFYSTLIAQPPIFMYSDDCNISTNFAGTSSDGATDGPIAVAQFSEPRDIAIDGNGNIYVADGGDNPKSGGHTLRKITTDGIVSTLAGMGGSDGHVDGLGSAARFDTPTALTFGHDGNLYVADARNGLIRKVTPSGMVSTFAGDGTAFSPGTGTSTGIGDRVRFIETDQNGDLIVVDNRDNVIKVTVPGAVVSLVLDLSISFGSDANGIAIDNDNNIFIANDRTIIKITPGGMASVFAGANSGGFYVDGPISDARFDEARDMTFDCKGNLYVTNGTYHNSGVRSIRKISPEGMVSTLIGSVDGDLNVDGIGAGAQYSNIRGLEFDCNTNNLYFVDTRNDNLKVIANCPADPIPTLGEWALIILSLLLLITATVAMSKTQIESAL